MINRNNPVPLYIQLRDDIKGKIKNEVWNIDSKIPTEKELMQEYNVGRATVREAITLLVNEGLIYKRKGIGTFVARKKPSLGFEPLISFTTSLEARGIESNIDVIEKREIIPDSNLLEKLKWDKLDKCYYLKRIRYIDNKPLALELSYFSQRFNDMRKYDLKGSLAKIMLKDLKLTIKKVEQVIIPRLPEKYEVEELKINEDTHILELERWIYIEDDESPFYYIKFIIPEDIYKYPY